jgi:predicted permease
MHVCPQGETYRPGESPSVFLQSVGQGYFNTLRIPLLAGRTFDSHDTVYDFGYPPQTALGVLINEKMARRLWPRKNAVGQIVAMVMNDPTENFECKVIGVVGNVRQSLLEPDAAPQLYMLGSGAQLIVRSREPLASLALNVRAALRQTGSDLILEDFKSVSQIVDQAVSPKRLIMFLVGLFSFLALLLASMGIYGVIAYSVSQRTQEIGIRLALGSPTTNVLRLIVGEGMKLAVVGCAIGLVAALALTRVIQSLLFGVSATDPLTIVASGFLLLAVALLACWLPARRAAGVNPMVALRHE